MDPLARAGTGRALALARRGDLEALEQIYRSYEGPIYNLARRLCARPEDAEEVLQEAFLEIIRSLPRYRGEGTLWAWIRKIAASKALMKLRSDALRSAESYDEIATTSSSKSAPCPQPAPVPMRLDLEGALALLTGSARAVVWLHDVEGYTHEEIGEMMGKSVSFSKSQLSRAHARLRLWLSDGEGAAS